MPDLDFKAAVLANPFNEELIGCLGAIGLKECYLTAGCLFQSFWNQISGRSPEWGIKDYDVFYFDNSDLSWVNSRRSLCASIRKYETMGRV